MKPGLSVHNSAGVGLADAKSAGNLSDVSTISRVVHFTNRLYSGSRVFVSPSVLALGVVSMTARQWREAFTTFAYHILHVVSLGTKKQVAWIYA